MSIQAIVRQAVDINQPTAPFVLREPLAYNDALAHTFECVLFDGEEPATLEAGTTVSGYFTRHGAGDTIGPLNGTVSGEDNNIVSVTLSGNCYESNGRYSFIMRLGDPNSDAVRTVMWVTGIVQNTQLGSSPVVPETTESTAEELIDALTRAQGAIISAAEVSDVVTLTDASDNTYTVPANDAFAPVQTIATAIYEANPNIFQPGNGNAWRSTGSQGVSASADTDGTLVTFSGSHNSSSYRSYFPLMGASQYSTANLQPGTYFFGAEQVTGTRMANIAVGGDVVSNQIVTVTEATNVYLRTNTELVSYDGCSARYWIIPLNAPTKFVPHSNLSAKDLVARAAAEGLKDYIDGQIAGVMLAIAAL